jgi:putative ABC transport system substrate-binding protein
MDRRAFLAAVTGNLVAAQVLWAQAPGKLYRLGIISTGNNSRSAAFYLAFENRMRELGWVDGKNLIVDFEGGDSAAQLSEIATRMVRRGADILLAAGPEDEIKAASQATSTVPVVIVALNYDPVQKGYVASLARPGRNITGISFRNPEVGPKQLELLRQALPRANRVGLLWSAFSSDQVTPIADEALRLRIQLEKFELASPDDIDKAFVAFKARRVDAVLALGDPFVYRQRARIAKLGLQQRVPIGGALSGAPVGYLMGFGPDLNAALRSAAEYVDKILRGAKPAEMPIEQPTKFELVINLATAKALGITIPQSLLLRADEVIR